MVECPLSAGHVLEFIAKATVERETVMAEYQLNNTIIPWNLTTETEQKLELQNFGTITKGNCLQFTYKSKHWRDPEDPESPGAKIVCKIGTSGQNNGRLTFRAQS